MDEIWSTLQTSPGGPLAWLVGAVLIGGIIWLWGHRMLKSCFAAAGFAGGLLAGFMLGSAFDVGIPAWLSALILALGMAVLATLAYRFAVATVCAVALGALAPAIVIALGDHGMLDDVSSKVPSMPEMDSLLGAETDESGGSSLSAEVTKDAIRKAIQDAREKFDALTASSQPEEQTGWIGNLRQWTDGATDRFRARWEASSGPMRTLLLGSAAAGAFVGFLGGLLATSWAAMLATAGLGSLGLVFGGAGIAQIASGRDFFTNPKGLTALIGVWIGFSCLGLVIQAKRRAKRADKND